MRLLIFEFLFLISSVSFGQTKQYQNLLDTAFNKRGGLFVYSMPLKNFELDKSEMWQYAENLKDYSNQNLDTVMFSQIIQNSKNVDTTIWKDNELSISLLVNIKDEAVSKKYAIQKLGVTEKKQIKFYKK